MSRWSDVSAIVQNPNSALVRGMIHGQGHAQDFIPQLIEHLMQERMPVDRMMTFSD
jgi:Zn-dependent alcohol dehydrogenase